ncbi:hypothetical protein [Arcobacter sp.]|uniref:hypothetical protein n=1 Tax=Arcobacter sp. TaxID=1872629 RepID=UPI003D10F33B
MDSNVANITSLISALSGLVGALIGGSVSYITMKQTNRDNEKIKDKELRQQEKLKKEERKERIFEECINLYGKYYESIFKFNHTLEDTINDYTQHEFIQNKNNIQEVLQSEFNALIMKKAIIKYKLSYIKENEFKQSLEKEFIILNHFYYQLDITQNIKYEYSMKGYVEYVSDLSKEHEKLVKKLENFTIN